MKALKISTLNKIYDRNKHLSEVAFLNAILDEFQIKFEIHEEDLKRLPKEAHILPFPIILLVELMVFFY